MFDSDIIWGIGEYMIGISLIWYSIKDFIFCKTVLNYGATIEKVVLISVLTVNEPGSQKLEHINCIHWCK